MKYVLFILISFISTQLFAQKHKDKLDYLVTINGNDTIYGKFKKKFMGELRFVSTNDETYAVDPAMFIGYYDASDKCYYEQKKIDGKLLWLTKIISGKINLYEQFYNTTQTNGNFISIKLWMAQKAGSPLLQVHASSYQYSKVNGKQNLEYLVRDNPRLFAALQTRNTYSYKIVKDAIEAYNSEQVIVDTSSVKRDKPIL